MRDTGCKRSWMLAGFVTAFFVLTVVGWAQTGTGAIQGTVKDASGSVVPGARVTILHTQTSRQYATTTTEIQTWDIFSISEVGWRFETAFKLSLAFYCLP
jgi:hypothetical protein